MFSVYCSSIPNSEPSEPSEPPTRFFPLQSHPVSRKCGYEPYLRKTIIPIPDEDGIPLYLSYMPSGEYPNQPAHFTGAYEHGCQLFAGAAMAQCLAAYGL
ncbi:MAG: hypothetical protein F6J87_07075 [Spirulina sp. SIO3F2]|nr:hypothetical protein [Spirulina sp. SIO3F2]